jgi:hypothetical protein
VADYSVSNGTASAVLWVNGIPQDSLQLNSFGMAVNNTGLIGASFSSSLDSLRALPLLGVQSWSRCVLRVFAPCNLRGVAEAAAAGLSGLSCPQSATGQTAWLPLWKFKLHYYQTSVRLDLAVRIDSELKRTG